MYWHIDLRDPVNFEVEILSSFEEVAEINLPPLSENHIYSTEPDISSIAVTVNRIERDLYSDPVFCKDVIEGRFAIDTVKNVRHYFIVGEKYEIVGKLVKVTDKFFKIINVMGLNTVIAAKIRLGPPFED